DQISKRIWITAYYYVSMRRQQPTTITSTSGRNCDAQRIRVVLFRCPVGYGRNGKRSRLDEIEVGTERRDRRRQLHDTGTRREGGRTGQDRQDLRAGHSPR